MGLAVGGCDRTDVVAGKETVTRFAVRDKDGFRHRLVVDGIVLRGDVTVVDRGESTFVNGHRWLPRPATAATTGYGVMDAEDSLRMLRIQFVARRARSGKPLLPVVNEWFVRRNSMGFEALQIYQAELLRSGDTTFAEALGRARFDPEIAESSLRHEHAPRFSFNSVEFYSPGHGWETFMNMGPRKESHRTKPMSGVGWGPGLAWMFEDPRLTVVVWLGDERLTMRGSPGAETAADQIDALTDPDTLQGATRLALVANPGQGLPPGKIEILRARHPLRTAARE